MIAARELTQPHSNKQNHPKKFSKQFDYSIKLTENQRKLFPFGFISASLGTFSGIGPKKQPAALGRRAFNCDIKKEKE